MESTSGLCFSFVHYDNNSFVRSLASTCLGHLPLCLYLPKQTSKNLLNTQEPRQKTPASAFVFFPSTRIQTQQKAAFSIPIPTHRPQLPRPSIQPAPCELDSDKCLFFKETKAGCFWFTPLEGGHLETCPLPEPGSPKCPSTKKYSNQESPCSQGSSYRHRETTALPGLLKQAGVTAL